MKRGKDGKWEITSGLEKGIPFGLRVMNPSIPWWDSFRSAERFTPVYVRISSGLRRGGFLEGGGGGSFLTMDGFLPVSRGVLSPVRFLPVYTVKKGY